MRRAGWRGESYRHYLAAKGVSTRKYLASTDIAVRGNTQPASIEESFGRISSGLDKPVGQGASSNVATSPILAQPSYAEILAAQQTAQEETRMARPEIRALAAAERGDVYDAVALLKDKSSGIDSSTRLALVAAVESRAFQLASGYGSVDPEVLSVLPSRSQRQIDILKKAHDVRIGREFESPISMALRKRTPEVIGGIVGAPERALELAGGSLAQGIKSGSEGLQEGDSWPGLSGEIDSLKSSPFVKDNAEAGWEEQASRGAFANVDGTRLNGTWDFMSKGSSSNPALAEARKTPADLVSLQVDSLFDNTDKLTKIDDAAYESGKKSFERGDREGLLGSIIKLRSEEDKLHDRQALVQQTRGNVLSIGNHKNSFGSGGGGSNILFTGSKGGEMLADQTRKINEVREAVARRHAEVATRRKILENDFTRLMTEVKPSSDMPRVQPTVLTQKQPFFSKFGRNAVVDSLKEGPYGRQ